MQRRGLDRSQEQRQGGSGSAEDEAGGGPPGGDRGVAAQQQRGPSPWGGTEQQQRARTVGEVQGTGSMAAPSCGVGSLSDSCLGRAIPADRQRRATRRHGHFCSRFLLQHPRRCDRNGADPKRCEQNGRGQRPSSLGSVWAWNRSRQATAHLPVRRGRRRRPAPATSPTSAGEEAADQSRTPGRRGGGSWLSLAVRFDASPGPTAVTCGPRSWPSWSHCS